MKVRIAALTLAACMAASPVQASVNAALGHALEQLGADGHPAQAARLRAAIESSPALETQMNALAASGRLTHFAMGEDASLPPKVGPFSARVHGTTWAFHADFVDKHGKQRLFDVVQPDDFLPDNLVFAVGHLAYKAEKADEADMSPASMKGKSMQQWMAERMNSDATATLQGWNDTVDAAQRENGGRPLSARQAADLLMNLQYRGVLIKAMQATGDNKLQIANDGRVEMTSANVAAVAKALSNSAMFDVQ